MPMLGQLAKGVVLYFPAQVSDVSQDGTFVSVQIPRYDPNPVLFLLLVFPLLAHAFTLGPLLSDSNHAHRPGIGVGEADPWHIPNLDSPAVPLHHLGRFLPSG